MAVLNQALDIAEAIRFRDDNPEMFGVTTGEGMADETYLLGLRDHLCNSVELVAELFPELSRAIEQVQHDLIPSEDVRAFISSDSTPQAWCMSGSENRTMVLGLTSGLVQLMTIDELKFVIGHEIGHYIMGHHMRIPPEDGGVESVNYRSLQRMAEISADRVGFLATSSSEAAYRAILKTASGLGEEYLQFDVGAFTAQFDKLKDLSKDKLSAGHNAYSTHPLLTVRCRALQLFGDSQPYCNATGKVQRPSHTRDELDDKIAADMYASTGYHPMAEIENTVRVNLIWLILRLFIEDGRFTKSEQAFLVENFEGSLAEKAIDFVRQHGPAAVCKKYEDALAALAAMKESARTSACRIVRRVASVAGGTEKERKKLLKEMHKRLACKDKARIEPWADEHSLGGLLELS